MKKKNILMSAIAILAIVAIATAAVPPPPANQYLGVNDTLVKHLAESNCRECHSSGLPDKHHLLVQNGEYGCMDCHPNMMAGFDRNCILCHNGSAYYANLNLNPGIPHHNTTWAYLDKNCTKCHGSYVDRENDGHTIPSYTPSLVTPSTSYKVYNSSSGRYWGGCLACHRGNTSVSPIIYDNNWTHHNLGKVTQGYPNPGTGCLTCHNTTVGALNIRTCEKCHGIKSLHNIQKDYVSGGPLGFGHVNNNWDCNGCHAFWSAGAAPEQGAIIPDIDMMTPLKVSTVKPTVVTITGTNFINDQYVSAVSVDGVKLTPTSVTNSQIVVTVPALSVGTHPIEVIKGDARSRLYTLVSVPLVDIVTAKATRKMLTITGEGFGSSKPDPLFKDLGVWINSNKVASSSIISWTDTEIVVKSGSYGKATVKALFGSDSQKITK